MTHEQQVLEDISSAINLWLGISTPNNCSPDDKCSMVSENIMLLLYNVIDLLSIKVCLLIFLGDVLFSFLWKSINE